MSKITKHILKLLYVNDCVIIPGFGGFIAQHSSAKFDESTGNFTPPSKQILFNKSLKNNDGLLINEIAQKQNISYVDAKEMLDKEIKVIKKQLDLNQPIDIEGIGKLYFNNEILNFKQDSENILTDSFGLPTININEYSNHSLSEEKQKNKVRQISKPNNKKWLVAAVGIPLIFISIWSLLNLKNSFESDINYSFISPFSFKSINKYQPLDLFSIDEKPSKEIAAVKNPHSGSPIDHISQVHKLESLDNPKFHVIVGCFGNNKNAKKLIRKLNKKGLKAFELDVHKKLHRVSIGSFSSKEIAKIERSQLKLNRGLSSWILKK